MTPRLNVTVQQLLKSFEPTAVPSSQLSDPSRGEKPIFEPASAR